MHIFVSTSGSLCEISVGTRLYTNCLVLSRAVELFGIERIGKWAQPRRLGVC
jgi:hypothetical protein